MAALLPARWDPSFRFVVRSRRQLVHEGGPDAVRDGPVHGVCLGRLVPGEPATLRSLVDAAGRPFVEKCEGIVPDGVGGYWLVVDRDDPEAASSLLSVGREAMPAAPVARTPQG
jgi:hypothetical protein